VMSADLGTGTRGTGGRGAGTREFILPDLGEGLTEAELISWKVAVGDTVHVDQMVVEVESAKSVVELPCPYAGRVVSLHAAAGDTGTAGQALLSVADAEAGGAGQADAGVAEAPAGAAAGPAQSGAMASGDEPESGGANLIGYGASEPKTRSSKERSFGQKAAAAAVWVLVHGAPGARAAAEGGRGPTAIAPDTTSGRQVSPVSSPRVRQLAKDHGIGAKHLPGSGAGGVVTRGDVLAAIESEATADRSVPAGTSAERDTRTPITGLRKVVSERLSTSRQEIPEATIWLDVDSTELLATKRALEERTGEKYSLLSLVARFVIAGLKKFPILNSSIDTAAGEIVTH